MALVLVTGGTGVLGRQLVPELVERGHRVRVLSRRQDPPVPEGVGAVRGDLSTGEGLTEALAGVEAVAHCATSPMRRARATDVVGTDRLSRAAQEAGCRHLLYISIVGIDRVPFPYYRLKREAEHVVQESGVPWTILRGTQFHDLILRMLTSASRLPFLAIPKDFVFQPVETAEVAARMAELLGAGPSERVPDMGGPEVRRMEDLARSYVDLTGRRRRVVRVPVPGKAGRGFRAGLHTCPDHADGVLTWERFLEARFGPDPKG